MKKSNASGLGSAMLGILILLSLLPTIASQINEGLTYLKKRNAADHLKTVLRNEMFGIRNTKFIFGSRKTRNCKG